MGVPIYKINYDFFNKDSEEYWYFAGFIASDGYVSDEKVELCLNKKDEEILKRFRKLISPDKPIYDKPSTKSKKFTIHSKQIAKHFKDLFKMTTNNKSKEMQFPNVPDKYLKDFVRGVFDGDGCIDTTVAYRTFNTYKKKYYGPRTRILGNYNFLNTMIDRIRKQVPNKVKRVQKKGKENVWYVAYTFRFSESVMNWLYKDATIYLKRKYKKYKEVIERKHEDIIYSHSDNNIDC